MLEPDNQTQVTLINDFHLVWTHEYFSIKNRNQFTGSSKERWTLKILNGHIFNNTTSV